MDLTYYMSTDKFRAALARMMQERGLNQSELAKKSGISRQLISSYLHGGKQARTPGLENLIALARALHCSLESLTGLESLKGIEKEADAIGDLSAEEKALLEAYNALSENDWEKKAVEGMLLKTKEVKEKKDSKDKAE